MHAPRYYTTNSHCMCVCVHVSVYVYTKIETPMVLLENALPSIQIIPLPICCCLSNSCVVPSLYSFFFPNIFIFFFFSSAHIHTTFSSSSTTSSCDSNCHIVVIMVVSRVCADCYLHYNFTLIVYALNISYITIGFVMECRSRIKLTEIYKVNRYR